MEKRERPGAKPALNLLVSSSKALSAKVNHILAK
jgi:hypothetical protein